MHATTTRLYEAAKAIKGITEPAALARAMNISPQVLNNWERRGISAEGILLAEETIGCESRWLKTGAGSLYGPGAQEPRASYHVTPDIIEIVATSIQAALQLGGLSADHMGGKAHLVAMLRQPSGDSYPETQIRAATEELMSESRGIISKLPPEQVAEALITKLRNWAEPQRTAPCPSEKHRQA